LPYQSNLGNKMGNAFLTEINATGNALLFSTYLGGSSRNWSNSLTLDGSNNVWLTGVTT
jgi:hypothetical protein